MLDQMFDCAKGMVTALGASMLLAAPLAGLSVADNASQTASWGHPGHGQQGDRVTPGEFVVEPATLISLGFEWYVSGDDNRNAYVTVQYRKAGTAWSQGMNMLRIHNEVNSTDATLPYTAPNMFAGSIMDLEANTTYEVQMTMHDPDGVEGRATQWATVKTRAQPVPYEGGNVYHVYPPTYTGSKLTPNFAGLLQAYYTSANNDDANKSGRPRVKPGDTIMIHAGTYGPGEPYHYVNTTTGTGLPFENTYYLTAKGTAERPIAIVAAGDGPVIFDGGNSTKPPYQGPSHVLFNVEAADYNYFEGLTIQNTDVAFDAGKKDIVGASGLTVKDCTFQNVGEGVWTEYAGSRNFYIADNTFVGREDPDHFYSWSGSPSSVVGTPTWQNIWDLPALQPQPTPYVGPIFSYAAIKVYGQGHVVAYNYITRFHDGFDFDTHSVPEGYPDKAAGPSLIPRENMPVANDFYNNDVDHTDDNCQETDGSLHNTRVLRNRCTNNAGQATSSQPTYAGPTYFIRNVTYNCPDGAIKFAGAQGSLFYNNTFTCKLSASAGSNFQLLNNLVLGQGAGEPLIAMSTFTRYSMFDYNGYRPNDAIPGLAPPSFASYASPPGGVDADYTAADLVTATYATLQAWQRDSGQDAHSTVIDWNVFRNATSHAPAYCLTSLGCDGFVWANALFPAPTPGSSIDLTLKPGSAAVDKGVVIPNVTDGYTGAAPDLGAYEFGKPIPHYGPRGYPLTGSELQYDQ
jgi:hypothetical protein